MRKIWVSGTRKEILVQPEKRASRLFLMGYVETWCQEGFSHKNHHGTFHWRETEGAYIILNHKHPSDRDISPLNVQTTDLGGWHGNVAAPPPIK
jgi:hypothetical protein